MIILNRLEQKKTIQYAYITNACIFNLYSGSIFQHLQWCVSSLIHNVTPVVSMAIRMFEPIFEYIINGNYTGSCLIVLH